MRTPRDATPSETIPHQSSHHTSSEKRPTAPFDGRRIKAAIVGTGAIAGSHLPALAALAAEGEVESIRSGPWRATLSRTTGPTTTAGTRASR